MSDIESPAETMRRAAALMLERGEEAAAGDWPDAAWRIEECAPQAGDGEPCPCIVYQGEYTPYAEPQVPPIQYVCDAETPEHATHIASWHPGVAGAVARWLQLEAARYAVHGEDPAGHYAYALDVAREYLGGVTP